MRRFGSFGGCTDPVAGFPNPDQLQSGAKLRAWPPTLQNLVTSSRLVLTKIRGRHIGADARRSSLNNEPPDAIVREEIVDRDRSAERDGGSHKTQMSECRGGRREET